MPVRKIDFEQQKYEQILDPPAGCFMNSDADSHVLPEVERRATVVVALAASDVSLS